MASQGLKRAIAAGAAAIMLGGAALGIVNAQGGPGGGTPPDGGQRRGMNREAFQQRHEQFLNTLAGKLGVSVDTLRQAMRDTRNELGGPGGLGRPGGQHGPRMGMRGMGLNAAAQALNITPAQLRQELAGKKLTDVAAAHNVSASTVSDALKAEAITHIDQAVANGRMTTDQANQAKQRLDQRINDLMNRTFPAAGQAFQGPRGPKGPQGSGQ